MQREDDPPTPSEHPMLRVDQSPRGRPGRPRSVTPPMLHALCDRLVEKPTLYLDKMADFI
jgi:hypothetical protein